MAKIDTNDFSGGIQESYSPDDFSPRQSAILKGIVPTNDRIFESQWPLQSIGSKTNINAIYPLESQFGTFLVAIDYDGKIWWCKAPADYEVYTVANSVIWTQITTAENKGYKAGDTTVAGQPTITIEDNMDYRFITGLPFEVFKYVKKPEEGNADKFWFDEVDSSTVPHSIVSGVLIHSRRFYAGTSNKTLQFKNSATGTDYYTQVAIVCYVDPLANVAGIVGPTVKAATFPNIRRWPWYYSGGKPAAGVTSTSMTLIKPFVGSDSAKHNGGSEVTFTTEYPHADFTTPTNKWPKFYNMFHPYTYLTDGKALNIGTGFIPRANVGTMWGNLLILGDVEYMNDKVSAANADTTLSPNANNAMLGSSKSQNILRDAITAPHRGSFYYSDGEIDKFDPRSIIRLSGTDTRIAGMHVVDNRLISITTAGGDNDGVVVYSGNLTQINDLATGAVNPFAVRRQVLKGGVGVSEYPDEGNGHTTQTCLWSETGTVLFIDRLGGIFATNGQSVNRIDTYGPKQPTTSYYWEHPAAVGKYAFVWRANRLMLFSSIAYDNGQASGCWTELVPPYIAPPVAGVDLKSMIGSGNNMYMVADGKVWRYALNGPTAERGQMNGVNIDITIATASFGAPQEYKKVNWDKFGINFSTTTGCVLKSININPGPALQSGLTPYTAVSGSRSFSSGYHSVIVPAGIGTRTIVSATYVLQGQFILESNTFWYNGNTSNKEKTYGEV